MQRAMRSKVNRFPLLFFIVICFFSSITITQADWVQTDCPGGTIPALLADGIYLFAGTDGSGIYLSTDFGAHWTSVDTDLFSATQFAVLGGNIFVGGNTGVFSTNDSGSHWYSAGLDNYIVLSFADSGKNLYAGTYGNGILYTSDGGNQWHSIDTGLTDLFVQSLSSSGAYLFAGTADNGVFLSTDNGMNWEERNNGLTNTDIYSFTILGANVW